MIGFYWYENIFNKIKYNPKTRKTKSLMKNKTFLKKKKIPADPNSPFAVLEKLL